jgi:hypothetical protein
MDDIVKSALEQFRTNKDHWQEIFELGRDDAYFVSGQEGAQWDERDIKLRDDDRRPCVTVDQLSQFIHQVANDIRMNTPTIGILPSDQASSKETADIIKGLIRNIEYVSRADDAYDTASLNAITCSIGFIRISHDYIDDVSNDQEILIERVVNPFAVFLDSNSVRPDGSDAKNCFVLEDMALSKFRKMYPDKAPVCFQSNESYKGKNENVDTITIAEYFVIDEQDVTLELDGVTRKTKKKTVKRYILSGQDVLEESTFAGKYIPLIPVYGEEKWIDGKRGLLSLIRRAKDAQRLFNTMKSNEIETLNKQPEAPFIAPVGATEDFADDYLNPKKTGVARYQPFDVKGRPLPAPIRLNPPTMPTGFYQAQLQAVDDIKASIGMYNASIGRKGNATSGKQELVQQQEGDVATFHFADNLNRSITQVGQVIVCMLPEIYDTPRALRIVGEEEEIKNVGVNGMYVEGQKEAYDLTKGKYDVRVVTGAPYTTKRQEAAEFFTSIVTQQPDLMKVMGDLLFKYSDVAGSEAMASRMKKVIDPQFLEEEDRLQIEQEKQQLQQVDPEKEQMKQVIQQGMEEMQGMQGELEAIKSQLQNKQLETQLKAQSEQAKNQLEAAKLQLEQQKLELEQQKIMIDAKKAETDQFKAQSDAELKAAELRMQASNPQVAQTSQPSAIKLDTTGFQFSKTEEQLALEQQQAESDMQKSIMEMEQERQEMEMKTMQTQAIIQSLESIKQSLDSLNRPKQVVYGDDGTILGVR